MSVEDYDVIDFMVPSDDGSSISLYAVENRPLRDDETQLFDINAKLGMYMHALGTDQVEEALDRVATLILVVPNEPRTPDARALLEHVHAACLDKVLGFGLHVQLYPERMADAMGFTEVERQEYDPARDVALPFPVTRERLPDEVMDEWLAADPERRLVLEDSEKRARRAERPGPEGESRLGRYRRRLGGRAQIPPDPGART